jgi:anthranilate synthase component II
MTGKGLGNMPKVTLVDNYDSFTWNLVHALGALGAEVDVHRNDAITVDEIEASKARRHRRFPRPRHPGRVRHFARSGPPPWRHDADLRRLSRQPDHRPGLWRQGRARPEPVHGKLSRVMHEGQTVFRGINGPFEATRYHSLVVDRDSLPGDLTVTAETGDGLIMALSHKSHPVHGVQFHPESIASEHGQTILKNFLDLAAQWNAARRT